MLRKFGGSIPELDRGATVGQIARLIIAGEELYEKEGDNSTDSLFNLNAEWAQSPPLLKPSSKRVFARTLADAVDKEFGKEFAELSQSDFGGMKLLVALHESARQYAQSNSAEGIPSSFKIYAPAAFGFIATVLRLLLIIHQWVSPPNLRNDGAMLQARLALVEDLRYPELAFRKHADAHKGETRNLFRDDDPDLPD